jgi:hypothetical protein
MEIEMGERRYLVQRIEWVTTGWKGPCKVEEKSECIMQVAKQEWKRSIENNRQICYGCSEANAFKDWSWYFNPPAKAPRNLNKGDVILVISPDKGKYWCVGLGFVERYERNKVECNPNTSIAFDFPKGHIEYHWGEKGYPKTGRSCFTYKIKKEELVKILEEAKKKHEEIKEKEIAQKIETAINIIKKGREMGEGEISENKTEQIGRILNAINTKPFIILSGISGTGKTQIARIISAGMVKVDSSTESDENKSREGK